MQSYAESLYSLDSRASIDSTNSRVCLLSAVHSSSSPKSEPDAELNHIIAYHERTQVDSLVSQRVQLTSTQKHNMQMAELASAVGRMSALRFKNQDYAMPVGVIRERRVSDIEGFMNRLQKLDVHKLHSQQRYSPTPVMPA
ncbi:hypothetical protein LPJ66_005781, partial [Kickxella alabastrina]